MENNRMYLTSLSIKNAGVIKTAYFEFKPNGLTKIVGMNFQGKSTALKAINFGLFGKPELPEDFRSHGTRETEIKTKLGNLEIIRTINKADNLGLKILKNGVPIKNPTETFIREFADKKCINPQPFIEKDSQAIYQFLCDYMNVDTTKIDVEIADLEDDRVLKHHEIGVIGKPVQVEKEDFVDIVILKNEKEEIRAKLNEQYQQNKIYNEKLRTQHQIEQNKSDSEICGFNEQQDECAKRKDEVVTSLRELQGWGYSGGEVKEWIETLPVAQEKKVFLKLSEPEYIEDLPDNSELLEIEKKVEDAAEINNKAMQYQKYFEDTKKLDKKQQEYDMFSEQIESKRQERKAMYIRDLPVEGLILDESAAYYKGFHCDNWSGAEKLDIAIDLLIAKDPKLRLVYIDNAEKLDSKMQKMLNSKTMEHDILAIITTVADIPEKEQFEEGVFYIQEGELVNG